MAGKPREQVRSRGRSRRFCASDRLTTLPLRQFGSTANPAASGTFAGQRTVGDAKDAGDSVKKLRVSGWVERERELVSEISFFFFLFFFFLFNY